MTSNKKFYIDAFIDIESNKSILISIDMINNVQNYFNVTNLSDKKDDILKNLDFQIKNYLN